MLNVFKMDIHRMLRSKAFYICLVFMNLITGTMILFDIVPNFASVMGISNDGTVDMMGKMNYKLAGIDMVESLKNVE